MQGADSCYFSESEGPGRDLTAAEQLAERKHLRKNQLRRERERWAQPADRVIEAGTGLGLVSMTAGSIVGAEKLTFEGKPGILKDARENFARNGLALIKSRWGVLKSCQNIKQPNEESDFDKAFWTFRLVEPGIIQTMRMPVFCLEDEITAHKANVLICDLEGREVKLRTLADFYGIRIMILETHYPFAGDLAMVRWCGSSFWMIIEPNLLSLETTPYNVEIVRPPLGALQQPEASRMKFYEIETKPQRDLNRAPGWFLCDLAG